MRTCFRVLLWVLTVAITGAAWPAVATDVFYSNQKTISANGRYKVEAQSPDNRRGSFRKPFQGNFVYTLTDTEKRRVLWKRKQGENEGSPASLLVDDDGWVIIQTSGDNLMFFSPSGEHTGTVSLLGDGLNKREDEKYVHNTTAGPMWQGYSHQYFLRKGDQRLFVIRPWWDRRIIMDVEKGRLTPATREISSACRSLERDHTLRELRVAVQSGKKWDEDECCEALYPVLKAAYLAGKLGIREAIPLLRELEGSAYIGSSTTGFIETNKTGGVINPQSYSDFELRRVAQLSLRRLGEIPRQLPVYEFRMEYPDYRKNHRIQSPTLPYPRHTRADAIRVGMKPEEVLATLGSPDLVEGDSWEYDMDTRRPYTMVLSWKDRQVKAIQRKSPPLWLRGTTRDEDLAY